MSEEDSEQNYGFISPNTSGAKDTASIIEKTDPTVISERLLRQLAGEIYDPRQGIFIRDIRIKPLINDEGLSRLKMSFDTLINQNTTLSNLNDKEIANIMHGFGREMINLLTINYKTYDIKSPSDATTILQAIMNNALFCLKRGYLAGEKKFLNTSLRTHETISHIQQPKQSKFGLEKFRF